LAGYLADVVVVQLERDQPLEVVKHAVVHDPTYYNMSIFIRYPVTLVKAFKDHIEIECLTLGSLAPPIP
jgi:hypothetical protein